MRTNKPIRSLFRILFAVFLLLNIIAAIHAYRFTHFSNTTSPKTDASQLTTADKISMLLTGVKNPRPVDDKVPSVPYEQVELQSNKRIEAWYTTTPGAKGTVALFHGYGGHRSAMLDKADELIKMGYNIMLVNFMGAGNSHGNQVTIGYKEAEQVATVYAYLQKEKNEKRILLFGTSMGAVAIMKAINDHKLQPAGIIIECPFGTMYQTVCARFKMIGVPPFPMAALLAFWGGVENGFWPFTHNPATYAKSLHCPTLLLFGAKDDRVTLRETQAIYSNIPASNKTLRIYPQAAHENYLNKYKGEWINDVSAFLNTIK
jgi:Lysophospholipase